jgi:hypothetical protein
MATHLLLTVTIVPYDLPLPDDEPPIQDRYLDALVEDLVFVPGIDSAERCGPEIHLRCADGGDAAGIARAIRLTERGGVTLFGGEGFEYYRYGGLRELHRAVV